VTPDVEFVVTPKRWSKDHSPSPTERRASAWEDKKIARVRFTLRVHLHARNRGGCCFGNDLGRYGGVKLILSAGPLLANRRAKNLYEGRGTSDIGLAVQCVASEIDIPQLERQL